MTTTKPAVTPELRLSLAAESEKLFKEVYTDLGVDKPYHVQKVCYKPKDKPERVIRMFPSELSRGDIYLELVDFDYQPLFFPRRLYKLVNRADYAVIYDKVEGASGVSFIVPFSALTLVHDLGTSVPEVPAPWHTPRVSPSIEPPTIGATIEAEEELEDRDEHYNTMTLRDHYCIVQNVPLSGKTWLNNLIKEGIKWQQNQK